MPDDKENQDNATPCPCGQPARVVVSAGGLDSACCYGCAMRTVRVLVESGLGFATYSYKFN